MERPPTRVAHIITGLSTGGSEMMLLKLLSSERERQIAHSVLSLGEEGPVAGLIRGLGVTVTSLGWRPVLPTIRQIVRLLAALRAERPDCLQGWMYHGNLAALAGRFALARRIPLIWNIRQALHWMQGEKRTTVAAIRLGARLSRCPRFIVYNSAVSAEQHEAIGYRPEARVVIPNGFDTDLFAPSETARVEIRSMLGLARSAVLIGLIGRYHPVKYHAGFLRVAARLGRAHPEVHFVLAGSGVDSHNCSLDSLIEESGLSGRVHLLGERKDIPRITAALDIAASASLSEAFPNVIGEAMSCAVPCVATNVGDTSHAIGDTGRVVSPKDEKAMEKALSELLNMGEASRRRLGLAARRRVIGLFSLPVVADRYRALYERVLSRKT